jgi:hypothetical protein
MLATFRDARYQYPARSSEDSRNRRMSPRARPSILLLLLVLACGAQGGVYRWVDADGNVHYTDTLPPTQVDKGHTEISEEGVRVRTVPPAKTPEEVQKERELERLRAEQERLIEKQRTADQVLLRTFRSDDDIIMARDGKLAAIDAMIQATRTNARRQQEWLARLQGEAADLERAGKPIPQKLSDNIAATEQAISRSYSNILGRESQKDRIRESFGGDLKRFRQLKNLAEDQAPKETEYQKPVLHNIVTCSDAAECDRLWRRAGTYVREHAMTQVYTDTPNLVLTSPPRSESDVTLILSRIQDKESEGASLFLDVQCQNSIQGEKTCLGPTAQDIIKGFRSALDAD